MPKSKKVGNKFRINVIKKHMNTWKSKAREMESVAKKCYTSIRKYIPKHEENMTDDDKEKTVELISMFNILRRI